MIVKSNGIDVYVEESGAGAGAEAILFVHYMGGSTAIWNAVVPAFADKYRVIAIDLRGHGRTELAESGYEMESQAEDVRGVLDALGVERVHVVGSSLGCYVATRFASLYPERVLSLVNSEGAMQQRRVDGESKEEHLASRFSGPEAEYESQEEYTAWLCENWGPWNEVRAKATAGVVMQELDNGRFAKKPSQAAARQIAGALYDMDLYDWYAKVTCPVLFLPAEAEGDLDGKLATIERVKPLLKHSKTVVIPGTTHAMMYDHHKELAEEMERFYGEINLNNRMQS